MINVIRDGRDVAISNRDAFGPQPAWVLRSAWRWNKYQALHRRLQRTFAADRYVSLRYEDLVSDPATEMQRLCQFLDEPYQDRVLRPYERTSTGFASHEVHKLSTLKPITADRVQRFRRDLSNFQIAQYEALAGHALREHGYPLGRATSLDRLARGGPVAARGGRPLAVFATGIGRWIQQAADDRLDVQESPSPIDAGVRQWRRREL